MGLVAGPAVPHDQLAVQGAAHRVPEQPQVRGRAARAVPVPAVAAEVDAGHLVDVALQQLLHGRFARPGVLNHDRHQLK